MVLPLGRMPRWIPALIGPIETVPILISRLCGLVSGLGSLTLRNDPVLSTGSEVQQVTVPTKNLVRATKEETSLRRVGVRV